MTQAKASSVVCEPKLRHYCLDPLGTNWDTPYARHVRFAHRLIDAVSTSSWPLVHHPRPIEVYRNQLIL